MYARFTRLDTLRGLAVGLMVIHHFLYDLVWLYDAPVWLFRNPLFTLLHYIFVGVFIGLSGICCRFSRSNGRRGVRLLCCAMAVTGVTMLSGQPILFGILHLLAFCMLTYALIGRWTDRIPLSVYCVMFLLSQLWVRHTALRSPLLWFFGVPWLGLFSADYFPIFPWIFFFLAGARVGGRLRNWQFVPRKPGKLAWLGQRSLSVYLLHQPALLAVLLPLQQLMQAAELQM